MSLLTSRELRKLESQYVDGVGSAHVVEVFRGKGHRFSEATLRKYVQLGLLPKSRRVGVAGRHRGSSGRYPPSVFGLINEIKQALDAGGTLAALNVGGVGLESELDVLRTATRDVVARFQEALQDLPQATQRPLRREVGLRTKELEKTVAGLSGLAGKIDRTRKASGR